MVLRKFVLQYAFEGDTAKLKAFEKAVEQTTQAMRQGIKTADEYAKALRRAGLSGGTPGASGPRAAGAGRAIGPDVQAAKAAQRAERDAARESMRLAREVAAAKKKAERDAAREMAAAARKRVAEERAAAARVKAAWSGAGDRFDDAGTALGRMRGHLVSLVQWFTRASVAAGIFTAGLIAQSVATGKDAKEITQQARALGFSTDTYQELTGVFKRVGVDASNFADFINTISTNANDATKGSKEMAASFALLGISTDDLKGKQPEQLLALLADGFKKTTNAANRNTAASKLFGDDLSRHVVPALQDGAKGLDAMRAAVRATGVVMDQQALAAATKLTSSLGTLGDIVKGLRDEFGAALAPALTAIVDDLNAWITANRGLIKSKIDRFAKQTGKNLQIIANALSDIDAAIQHWGGWESVIRRTAYAVGLLAAAFVAFEVGGAILAGLTAIGSVMAALFTLAGAGGLIAGIPAALLSVFVLLNPAVWVLAASLGAVTFAFVALGLVLEDIWTYFSGGKSILGSIVATGGALGTLGRIVVLFASIGAAAFRFWLDGMAGIYNGAQIAFGGIASLVMWLVGVLNNSGLLAFFNTLNLGLDKTIAAVNGITGATFGLPGGAPTGSGAGAGGGTGSALLPVSPASRGGGAAAAPANNTATTSLTINGAGITVAQAQALFQQLQDQAMRAAFGSFVGGAT